MTFTVQKKLFDVWKWNQLIDTVKEAVLIPVMCLLRF